MKQLTFEIRSIQLGKSGDTFDTISDTTTNYHFAAISNPVNDKEKVFWVNTISTWSFDNGNSIHFGCMIFFFPSAYGIENPTLEDFKTFSNQGVEEINKVLKKQLEDSDLPSDLELQPIQERRDFPLLNNAYTSWTRVN
jgi:hypothetical protein